MAKDFVFARFLECSNDSNEVARVDRLLNYARIDSNSSKVCIVARVKRGFGVDFLKFGFRVASSTLPR